MKKIIYPLSLLGLLLSSCTIRFVPNTSEETESKSPEASLSESEISLIDSSFSLEEGSEESASSDEESELSSEEASVDDYAPADYHLAWSDEFDGDSLDLSTWGFDLGSQNGGWGNREAEYYTDHNHSVKDGLLKIEAKREHTTVDEREFDYTSSRLVTKGKKAFTYGYMCARISLPAVEGLWPAFWMLPETGYGNEGTTWWPTSGEIDIMEARGRLPTIHSSALHFASDGTGGSHTYVSREHTVDSIEDFHVYAVLWEETSMRWYIDGEEFFSTNANVWNRGYGTGDGAPFNKDFHFLINLAIGGNFDSGLLPPEEWDSSFMKIDYLRVYQAN